MPTKLNVYNMADKGVNTSKSPLHLEDGELTTAQNFQTDPTLADGCIRRRDGMSKLNSSALAGSVKGLIAMPLPDEFAVTRTFYAPIDGDNTNTWRISTTGAAASWSTITDSTLNKAAISTQLGEIFITTLRGIWTWAALDHKIYYPGNDYNSDDIVGTDTPPTLYSWNGTTAVKLISAFPTEPNVFPELAKAITCIVPYSRTELLIGTSGTPGVIRYAALYLYDLVTGDLTQLGPATTLSRRLIFAPFIYQGRIWIAPTYIGTSGTTNTIQWIRPGDAEWTVDASFEAIDVGGVGMVEFLGDLYLGTHSTAAVVARIRKRATATGAWTTVASTDGTGTGQYIGPLIVTADGLTCLAYYNGGNGGAPLVRILSSTDGTSWATDDDVVANVGAGYVIAGVPYLDRTDGSIYWMMRLNSDATSVIRKRTSAGVWSTVDTLSGALKGPILPLNVVTA